MIQILQTARLDSYPHVVLALELRIEKMSLVVITSYLDPTHLHHLQEIHCLLSARNLLSCSLVALPFIQYWQMGLCQGYPTLTFDRPSFLQLSPLFPFCLFWKSKYQVIVFLSSSKSLGTALCLMNHGAVCANSNLTLYEFVGF